jgi:hypothetical protein
MPTATLFTWLKRGWITDRQDTRAPHRWIVTADQAEVERLRALHQLPPGHHNRHRWTDAGIRSTVPADKEPDTHAREALRNSH